MSYQTAPHVQAELEANTVATYAVQLQSLQPAEGRNALP